MRVAPSNAPRSHVVQNLRWGVGWGTAFAGVLSAFMLGMAVLRRSTTYLEYHATTWGIIASYWAVGVPAGALVGLLRPITRYRLGAVLVGWIAGTVVYGGIGVVMDGPTIETLVIGLICGAFVGGICGYSFWRPPASTPPA